jgi:type II secretory pathway predicted ATPase ExeA
MYRTHFGLTCHPFSKDLSPEELFISDATKELEARLLHLIDLGGIGLFTGPAGCGKTTACRKVVSLLHTGSYRAFYISNSSGCVMDLYKSIAFEFGVPVLHSRAALYRNIQLEITRLCVESHLKPILFMDEAHRLRSDVLEDLRVLTNYEMDSQNRLCLVLIGQSELRRRLTMAVHESLNQRILIRHHMNALTLQELPFYLKHLLRRAGTELPVFEEPGLEILYQSTQGLPRKVNLLAHHALTAAALARAKIVSIEHIQAALPEVA